MAWAQASADPEARTQEARTGPTEQRVSRSRGSHLTNLRTLRRPRSMRGELPSMTHGRPGRAIRSRRKGRAAETRPGFVDGYTGSSHLQKTQTAGPAPRRAENLSLSSGICYFDLGFWGPRPVGSPQSRARVSFKVIRMSVHAKSGARTVKQIGSTPDRAGREPIRMTVASRL